MNKRIKIHLYQRLWMNKKRPIPEVVDEKKEAYPRGCERTKRPSAEVVDE